MRSTYVATFSTCLALVSAAPVAQHGKGPQHQHARRQDWSAVDWGAVNYNVDWSKVDYSGVDWNSVFGVKPAATPAPSPAEPEAVVINGNAVQAIPNTPVQVQAAATPAPAASNVQVAAPANNNHASGKRGLGWDPAANVASAAKFANSQVGWYFNWAPTATGGVPSNWEFYANIWGSGGIDKLASQLTGSPKLIGFNEPDSPTQANLAVGAAVSLYYQYLTPLKQSGAISQLGSPAVTNSANPGEGLDWLGGFMAGCAGCGIDFVVVHWYAASIDDFKNHVTKAHQMTGLPVNVAEFAYTTWNSAAPPSDGEVSAFMDEALSWLDAQDFVSAYAWFGSMYVSQARYPGLGSANSLITEDLNSLTSLGYKYVS